MIFVKLKSPFTSSSCEQGASTGVPFIPSQLDQRTDAHLICAVPKNELRGNNARSHQSDHRSTLLKAKLLSILHEHRLELRSTIIKLLTEFHQGQQSFLIIK